uniref:Leucine-rich repeat protein n=1 Tax=Tanacetum cinerariifolium TaxID=118510 RepID=A0A699IR23_TANCI|nr:leucine-rich repeat protein [Tanacetum cinerariifolium]
MVDFVAASPLRRNIKLQDEEGIGSLPDMELFENLTLMGYNISSNQKFTFQKGFNEFSSNIATALVCLATNRTYNFSKMIFDGLVKNVNNKVLKFLMYPRFVPLFNTMLIHQGKGSGTPTKPHHTPSQEAQPSSHTHISSPSIPTVTSVPTILIPTATPSETTPIRQYTRRHKIAQSFVLPLAVDEPASPLRDISQGKACPTASGFIADQDRATIAKTSTLPHDSAPRVTSPATDEGRVEINRLKERVKQLEVREGVAATNSGDDAPIKRRSMDEGEAATERVNDDTKEMATMLTSMDAATVLASGIVDVPTSSGSIPIASTPAKGSVPTGSEEVPTSSLVFATANVVTPYRTRKGKEVMRRAEQIARDAEIARIHAEEELQSMIDGLDSNNETVAKYLEEYRQFSSKLPMERRIELISDLVKYQDNYTKVYKFQSQQRNSWTKKQKRDYYMAVIRNNLGWKVKDFKAKKIKRKGINLEQESAKKQKSSEEITKEAKSPEEVTKEKIKEMMQLVPIEEVYVEALQVKHPTIDWEVHTEGQRAYWKITRLGGGSASYQFFTDLLKHLDRDDLNQLWSLVKETLSKRQATSDKEMEL